MLYRIIYKDWKNRNRLAYVMEHYSQFPEDSYITYELGHLVRRNKSKIFTVKVQKPKVLKPCKVKVQPKIKPIKEKPLTEEQIQFGLIRQFELDSWGALQAEKANNLKNILHPKRLSYADFMSAQASQRRDS